MPVNPYRDLHRAWTAPGAPAIAPELRKSLIWAYSWAVPDESAVAALREFAAGDLVLEVGAGTGYWAWLLAQAGVRMVATDVAEHAVPRWTAVEPLDARAAVARHRGAGVLLLVWPELDSPMANEALAGFTGDRVAYAGEWGGRTADAAFHARLTSEFRREAELVLPRWPGFGDTLTLHRRR
jgi:hypothetical protein